MGTPATEATLPKLDVEALRKYPEQYTTVDGCNAAEATAEPLFAINLPRPYPARWSSTWARP